MEHKPCSCGCCRESSLAPHETKAVDLFAGVQLFYLPEAASAAAAGKEDAVLRVYACRRGSLSFETADGHGQTIHAGKLAVWKEAGFQEGTITPDDGFCGLLVRVDLRKLTEQPPESLSGADVTGERLYDLYCVREDMTLLQADAQTDAIVDMFYAKPAQTVRAWQRLGAQALLLQLGAVQTDGDMAQEELSEQVRAVHAVHAYLTQHLETRVTIEELSKQYLMNPTTLKQVFKSVYGRSLAAHMKEHRMGRAAQLLRETDESVAEIARAVGYESQSKFTAAFKEYFGALPKEYRKNH